MGIGQRAQQQAIGEAENQGCGAYAERENEDRGGGGGGIFAEDAEGVADVLSDHVAVLAGGFADNAPDGAGPEAQGFGAGSEFAAAVSKAESKLAGVFVAESGRVGVEEGAVEPFGRGHIRLAWGLGRESGRRVEPFPTGGLLRRPRGGRRG